MTRNIAVSWECVWGNARIEFSCRIDAVPACLPAWGLGAHGAEFDESLHVQLINVCNGIHQASCKPNLDVLTNDEWKWYHTLQVGSDN